MNTKHTHLIDYIGKKPEGTFTVTVWGSARDSIDEKHLKEAFLAGLEIAKADSEAAKSGKTVEFCNGGTGHGCMKWSAIGYLVGGGRNLYAINTKAISIQEESKVVQGFIEEAPLEKNNAPLCVIADLKKELTIDDIKQILRWEKEDNKAFLPDSIRAQINLNDSEHKVAIGNYNLIIWQEIQVRMLEMIHRADLLINLTGGMGTGQESMRAILDLAFEGMLTKGLYIAFGGQGHWSQLIDHLKEEFPTIYKAHLNGRENPRLREFASIEELRNILTTSVSQGVQQDQTFDAYLAQRMSIKIHVPKTQLPQSENLPLCLYTGQFNGQNYTDGMNHILDAGFRGVKLSDMKYKSDHPHKIAFTLRAALEEMTSSKDNAIILELDHHFSPKKESAEDFERRKLMQLYAFMSVYVAQQVNEPTGINQIPVYLVLPLDKSLEGYLTEGHTVLDVFNNLALPPHIHDTITAFEKTMQQNGFIKEKPGVVYQPVTSVEQALALHASRQNNTPDPRIPKSLAALRAENTPSIQK